MKKSYLLLLLLLNFICFSQDDNYKKLTRLPKIEFEKAVSDSIVKLQSGDLWNFLKVLRDDYKKDLKPFNTNFIKKMENTKWAMDMHFLLSFLIEQKTDKAILEDILNRRKAIWNKENWSLKFSKIIVENDLNVSVNMGYSIYENGQKNYSSVRAFLEEKLKSGDIGKNPLLYLDNKITDYEPNKLIETLEKMDIKDIQIAIKALSPQLYGSRGTDGTIEVLRR